MLNTSPFSHQEAVQLWSRLVAGWAHSLDDEGARTLMDGYPNRADVGGSYEGVTRMMWGLGGWLSRPDRPSNVTWRGESFDLVALTRRALLRGCDPASPACWGQEYQPARLHDQRTVESGQVAFAIWQSREQIWNHLNPAEHNSIFAFLERFARRPVHMGSNWSLFWVLNHASRKALGLDHDQGIIEEVLGGYLDAVYCGDGWYDDAGQCGTGYFDDYNFWVFASHMLAWAQVDGDNWPERRDELLERIRLLMAKLPYFFAADGAYCEFGRSLAYKFARLGAPLWAYKLGVWPHSPGMLKRVVGRHLRWYTDQGAIRADGTLRQSLTAAGSPEICEAYISTGATYWAMQAFGGLWSLPDDDPLWSAEEEALPAESGDFVKVYPQPGWIITGRSGEVQRFNAGSVKDIGAKYAKFVYSTRFPFNVGLSQGSAAPDNMLSLGDGKVQGQRSRNLACSVDESIWLRILWEQDLNGLSHRIDSVIVIRGDQHLRAHRIQLAPDLADSLSATEGCAPLAYNPGQTPMMFGGPDWIAAGLEWHMTAILNIRGYTEAAIWDGTPGINSVYPYDILPVLRVSQVKNGQELICLVHHGDPVPELAMMRNTITASWQSDGSFHLNWAGDQYAIPPLSSE